MGGDPPTPSSPLAAAGGDPKSPPQARDFASTMEVIKGDAVLSEYLRPDFGLDRLVSEALGRPNAETSAQCEGLERGIAMLDVAIKDEVVGRRGPLLSHVEGLTVAEQRVGKVRAQVETLKRGLAGSRSELDGHRRQAKRLVAKMAVLRETTDLARVAGRLSRWAGRLRSELKDVDWAAIDAAAQASSARGAGDGALAAQAEVSTTAGYGGLPLAATLVRDYEAELKLEPRVRGLDFVAGHARFVEGTRENLARAADTLLTMGTANDRPAETAVALQIFYNLGQMRPTVEQLMEGYKSFLRDTLRGALNSAQEVSKGGEGGTAEERRERYWEGMRGCATRIAGIVVRVWHLQRVLQRKRDPTTYQPFLEILTESGKPLLARAFFESVLGIVDQELGGLLERGGAARDLLRDQYPYLVNFLLSILSKSEEATESIKGVPPLYRPEYRDRLVSAARPFVDLHLVELKAKSTTLVTKYFADRGDKGGSTQRRPVGSVHPLVRTFSDEMESLGHSQLAEASIIEGYTHIADALALFVDKAGLHVVSSGRDVARIEKPTPAQLCNIALCVQCLELDWRMKDALKRIIGEEDFIMKEERTGPLPKAAVAAIEAQLERLRIKAGESVETMFAALSKGAEEKVAKMHAEFSAPRPALAEGKEDVAPSDFVAGLSALLKLFSTEYLNRFPFIANRRDTTAGTGGSDRGLTVGESVTVVTRKLSSCATRILATYTRHACLASPWSDRVAQAVAKDAAEVEKVVSSYVWPARLLGEDYLSFKGFKLLAKPKTQRLPELPTADLVKDTGLSTSDAAHHLLARCAGLDAGRTQLPHARRSLTPLQYALWLDGRDKTEVWKGITQAVDAVEQPGEEVAKILAILKSLPST